MISIDVIDYLTGEVLDGFSTSVFDNLSAKEQYKRALTLSRRVIGQLNLDNYGLESMKVIPCANGAHVMITVSAVSRCLWEDCERPHID